MPYVTTDTIRDISVKAVEMFLNDKIPLSQGLAKQASALELNADQIQRAVEATNSIAYLKILGMADDRTVEFPLCKYAEVMTSVAVPDLTKAASITIHKTSAVGKTETLLEKVASTETMFDLNDAEKRVVFIKMASTNEAQLQALKDREVTLVPELQKAASLVKADNEGLEKLATVASGKDYAMLSALVYGEVKPHNDTGLFKSAELKQAEKLVCLFKEAQELSSAIKEKQELHDRSEIVKQAFLGMAGRAIGSVMGSMAKAPAKAVTGAVKGIGTLSGKKKFGLGGALGMGATAAFDASMYKPGIDKTTGRSKDVWTSLQREPN